MCSAAPGRNDPCPCGSGRKFKHCCLQKHASEDSVRLRLRRVEGRVAGEGRLLVRYSGTEPLLRVMLEGRHEDEIRAWAQEIVDVMKEHLG